MKTSLKYKLFIGAFIFLYIMVAFISFVHSIQFFNVGNAYWMSVMLGIAYELGQAVVLASILLSDNRKSLLTWILFIILTAVQVVGNVFSVYKFISESGAEYYKFIEEPLLFWIYGINEQTVKVIISWITGALLPIVALGMTGMVASNLQILSKNKDSEDKQDPETQINTQTEPVNEVESENSIDDRVNSLNSKNDTSKSIIENEDSDRSDSVKDTCEIKPDPVKESIEKEPEFVQKEIENINQNQLMSSLPEKNPEKIVLNFTSGNKK